LSTPVGFSELAFEDFSCSSLGQRLEEVDALRKLEHCQMLSAVGDEFLLCNLLIRLQDNQGLRGFTQGVMRNGYHSTFQQGRMGQ